MCFISISSKLFCDFFIGDTNAIWKTGMRIGRGITDENWLKSSIGFNRWLKENANQTTPNITLLNNSELTPKEAAEITDRWILKKIKDIER